MRITAAEAVTIVFRLINSSLIKTSVTSNIFKYERPLNFTGECIVVNALPLTADQFQEGIINVNYFVPNLINTSVDPVDDTQPNAARLQSGGKIIDQEMSEVNEDDHHISVLQTTLFSVDDLKQWCMNFRVLIKNVNL